MACGLSGADRLQVGKERDLGFDPCFVRWIMLPNNSEMLLVGGGDRNLSLYTKEGTRLAPLLHEAAGDAPTKDASGPTVPAAAPTPAPAADPGSNWLLCAAKREIADAPQIVRLACTSWKNALASRNEI